MAPEMKVIMASWGVLALVWGTAALHDSMPITEMQSKRSRVVQTALLACGFGLLYIGPAGTLWFERRIFAGAPWISWLGVSAVLIGTGLAIWARSSLGGNWSGTAALKEGHILTRSGPYRFVRHPIYTGILAAVLGTALANGSLLALFAVPLCTLSYWLKIHSEERLLLTRFGSDYLQYRQRVKALVPYLF
jgi:protein-S-isoprenylcysteine O-methyltransferase Ste14